MTIPMPLKYRIKRDLLVYAIKRFIFECIIAYPFLISFQVLNNLHIVLPPPFGMSQCITKPASSANGIHLVLHPDNCS